MERSFEDIAAVRPDLETWKQVTPRSVPIAPRSVPIAPRYVPIAPRFVPTAPRYVPATPRSVTMAGELTTMAGRRRGSTTERARAFRYKSCAPFRTCLPVRRTDLGHGVRENGLAVHGVREREFGGITWGVTCAGPRVEARGFGLG
eukprot:1120817-Rhodomonas_salina.1